METEKEATAHQLWIMLQANPGYAPTLIAAALDSVIMAEREACARVAETMVAKSGPKGVARAIRARGTDGN